jgi:hypothetical protein
MTLDSQMPILYSWRLAREKLEIIQLERLILKKVPKLEKANTLTDQRNPV